MISRQTGEPAMTRILVVDDEPEITEMLKVVLSLEGWLVDQASSAEEALELTRREHFDIIVLDHQMPIMSGLEAAQRLVFDEGAPPGSVVLFSGFLSAFIRAECRALGIHAIDKVNWEDLVDACRAIEEELTLAVRAPVRPSLQSSDVR